MQGSRLGPYRLEEHLGEGSTGIVVKAVREPDEQVVALKVLRPELGADETYRRRFVHEARVASDAAHPHLVAIVDAGELEGRPYIASRYVEGRSLEERIHVGGPLPLDELRRLSAHLAGALDELHRCGLVHRDIKPSNVVLDKAGSAWLTDFGLAKGPAYTVLTKPGEVMGTLDYLAPELIRGESATPATDIYALGCLVFEALAGAPPFAGRSLFEVGAAHLGEEPPDLTGFRSDVSSDLAWAVTHALAKSPDRRPPTATAYARILAVAARRG